MRALKRGLECAILSILLAAKDVSPANLCSGIGLCCKHRDSDCVAQRIYLNHTVDTTQLPCYCDHACMKLGDCCLDYRQYCNVKDCLVSEWGPWTPCSADQCDGFGVEERHRIVLIKPENGGLRCPHLTQSRQCKKFACTEDEWLIPDQTSSSSSLLPQPPSSTPPTKENIDIQTDNEDLQVGDHSGNISKSYTLDAEDQRYYPSHGCIEMVIIRATAGCRRHDKQLNLGTRICIRCLMEDEDYSSDAETENMDSPSRKEDKGTCSQLAETPIRNFRINHSCHGKLTFLAKNAADECHCDRGLNFKLSI